MSSAPLTKSVGGLTFDRLFWWIALIGATAACVLLGAFFFYWLHFGTNSPSTNPNEWGPFGDFIGGVTNPILSFFALLSLLLALVVQSKQLEATREQLSHAQETARKQISHMELQARKGDLHRSLQVLEARLERLYREPIYVPKNGRLSNGSFISCSPTQHRRFSGECPRLRMSDHRSFGTSIFGLKPLSRNFTSR